MTVRGIETMTSAPLGVLVVGAGWVSTQHIAAYKIHSNSTVLAICDRTLEKAQRRVAEAALQGTAVYDDFEKALRHPGIDIVSICTPQHAHCRQVVAAAEAGKHMLIEKPLGISLDELDTMRRAVRKAGVRTGVGFVLRWNPLFRALKAMLADNVLGRPFYVETDYLSHNGSWWSGWNDARTVAQGVSAFLVGGCHAIDALRWFASSGEFEAASPAEVYAVAGGYRKGSDREYNPQTNTWVHGAPPMEYDGLEVAVVKFDNGALGKVSVNADCIMPYRFPVRIFGNLGTVFDNRIWSHRFAGQTDWVELPTILPDSSSVNHHPFQAEIDHLLECVATGQESHCNLEDAIKTHEIAFAALESQRTGQPVRLPMLNDNSR
jgi:predicted dehydrogenase